jgi:hypothetical protein
VESRFQGMDSINPKTTPNRVQRFWAWVRDFVEAVAK